MQMSKWAGMSLLEYPYKARLPANVEKSVPVPAELQQPDWCDHVHRSSRQVGQQPGGHTFPKYFYWCHHEGEVREVEMKNPPFLVRLHSLYTVAAKCTGPLVHLVGGKRIICWGRRSNLYRQTITEQPLRQPYIYCFLL